MSEQSQATLPEDEQEALGLIIDKIASENPNLAEAVRLCAIPHGFNAEILTWLRGEGSKRSTGTETLLETLKSKNLAFVRPDKLFFHDNVRKLLVDRWLKNNSEDFKKLNEKVAAYYDYKLKQSVSDDQGHTPDQRAQWEREEMYHLLVADEERGRERFKSLCNKAIDSYRLSTLDLLLSLAGEQVYDPSVGIQTWIQFFQGKKHQVTSEWQTALDLWEKLKEKRAFFTGDLEPTLAVHLTLLYKDKGDWNKAIECLNESLRILEDKGNQSGTITILNNRGFLYKDRGDFEGAERDFQRGFEISTRAGDEFGKAISLKNLGLLYKDLGLLRKDRAQWDNALEQFHTSLAIVEKTGDQRLIARSYDDRGLLYKDRGLLYGDREDLQRAEKDFLRALKILARVGSERQKAGAFNSLGLFYKDRGLLYKDRQDLQEAENNFQRAREILEKLGDQRRISDIFNYLGFLYTAAMEWHAPRKHFRLALTNFQEALKILKEMRDDRGSAVILNNLGLLYKRSREPERAIAYFQQSLAIVEGIGDKMNAATTMYELALLYEFMGEYREASELLTKVVKISKRVGHPDPRIKKSSEQLRALKAKVQP